MGAGSLGDCDFLALGGAEIDDAPSTNATKKGVSLDKEHMVRVTVGNQVGHINAVRSVTKMVMFLLANRADDTTNH